MRRDGIPRLRTLSKITLWAALSVASVSCMEPDLQRDEGGELLRAESASGAHAGSWAARATLGSSPSWKKLIQHDNRVSKQTTYAASIWVKGTGKLRLDIVNHGWTGDLASVFIDAPPTWTRFVVPSFNTGTNEVVHFSVYDAVGGTAGTVYLDDAFLGLPGGSNLLSNPGFESGADRWSSEGVFSVERMGSADVPPAVAPTGPAGNDTHTGSWAAQATLANGPTWTKLNHYDSRVSKQTTYAASIWVKGTGKLRLDIVNHAWTDNLASVLIDAPPTWTRFAVPNFNTGTNEVIHFSVYDAVGGTAGTVYLDDAFLGPPGGPNLLSNPGFESGDETWIPEGVFRVQRAAGGAPSDPDPVAAEPKPDPNGTYFAEVEANGTGCPAGSWNTRISRDGLVFTTTFSAYEARLDPGATLSVKDCQLSIKLHTPQGTSFSVQSFSYTGYAIMERGVVGRQLASYYFQGQSVQADAARTDLVGPYDDAYLFKDDVPLEDAVWSPCGVERDLNVTTRIVVQSNATGLSGYMNLTAADGSARMVLQLASRPCSEFGAR